MTNEFGIEWLRRHLGPSYTIHKLDFGEAQAMHIDATFVPLEPGKLLIKLEPLLPLPPSLPSLSVTIH